MAKFSLSSATIKLAYIGSGYGTFGTRPNMQKAVQNGQTRPTLNFSVKFYTKRAFCQE
jgi:hypothetical protein